MELYIPSNVIVTKDALAHPGTEEILGRIKKLNPDAALSYSESERPGYPELSSSAERYHYMKKTLILGCRKSPFIETFPSPGRIVEDLNTMIKTGLNCSNECQYCYLQRTAIRQPWQKISVNLDSVEAEIRNEFEIDPAIRSVLSILDRLSGCTGGMDKIPAKFKAAADKFRDRLSKKGRCLTDESKVVASLRRELPGMLEEMKVQYDRDLLDRLLLKLDSIYMNNRQRYQPWFNISEYTDLLSVNHISRHVDYFLELVEKIPDFRITFYTKSANVEPLLKYKGNGRVKVVMHLEPEHVISSYQKRTASLTERLEAVKKLQKADGFLYKLQFEPVIMYPGYEKDYLDVLKKALKTADFSKLSGISFGSIRYAPQLIGIIKNNYPGTDLFSSSQNLVKPASGKDKWRYPSVDRLRIYSILLQEVRKHTDIPVKLGAENPELWQMLKLSPEKAKDFYCRIK